MNTKRKAAKSAAKAAKRAKSGRGPKGAPKLSAKAAYSTATSPNKTVKQRVAAMPQVPVLSN